MADQPNQQPQPQSDPKDPKRHVPPVEIDPQLEDYAEKMEVKPERKK